MVGRTNNKEEILQRHNLSETFFCWTTMFQHRRNEQESEPLLDLNSSSITSGEEQIKQPLSCGLRLLICCTKTFVSCLIFINTNSQILKLFNCDPSTVYSLVTFLGHCCHSFDLLPRFKESFVSITTTLVDWQCWSSYDATQSGFSQPKCSKPQ
jgi:hypothetical protein